MQPEFLNPIFLLGLRVNEADVFIKIRKVDNKMKNHGGAGSNNTKRKQR